MSVRDTIRINLKELMVANKVRNVDLARAIGVSKTAVTYWLNGVNSIDIEHMLVICSFFEVSIDEFLSHSSVRPFDVNEERLLDMYRTTGAEGKEDILAAARRSLATDERGSSVASE